MFIRGDKAALSALSFLGPPSARAVSGEFGAAVVGAVPLRGVDVDADAAAEPGKTHDEDAADCVLATAEDALLVWIGARHCEAGAPHCDAKAEAEVDSEVGGDADAFSCKEMVGVRLKNHPGVAGGRRLSSQNEPTPQDGDGDDAAGAERETADMKLEIMIGPTGKTGRKKTVPEKGEKKKWRRFRLGLGLPHYRSVRHGLANLRFDDASELLRVADKTTYARRQLVVRRAIYAHRVPELTLRH